MLAPLQAWFLARRGGWLISLAILLTAAEPVLAQEPSAIEAGASQNYFYIQPSYDGTTIILFGAVDRDRLNGQPFDIAVTIRGPLMPVTIWKKDRRAGLWVNSESQTFEGVPNYYAVLSTRPAPEIAPIEERKAYDIGLDALNLPLEADDGSKPQPRASKEFQRALVRLKQSSGLFVERGRDAIEFIGPRLFRSRIELPASAGAGLYRAKFYLLQNGKVLGETSAHIRIKKIGIEARLSSAALNYPWLYGMLAVAVAAAVGGGASLVFRRA